MSASRDYSKCLMQYLGTWDSETGYSQNAIEGLQTIGGSYYSMPVVLYSGSTYILNNSSSATIGTTPDTDSSWSVLV